MLREASTRYPTAKIQFSLAEAQLLRDAEHLEESLSLLEKILAQQPEQADVLYEAALVAEQIDRLSTAETYLRRVIHLQPKRAHAYNALGYSLADRNIRLEEAHALLTQALALAPQDPFILDSMGWLLFRRGELTAALSYLETAYKTRPDPEIAAHLGEVLWAANRRQEAMNILEAALVQHPSNKLLQTVIKKFQPKP